MLNHHSDSWRRVVASPLHVRRDLFGLPHHVLDDLRGGFDVVH
jgi:hypothetical protein